MDESWIKHNMRRMQVGMDMYLNPEQFAAMHEELDQSIAARVTPYMVKLMGLDGSGNAVSCGSGFLYTAQAKLIVTCNHVRYYVGSAGQQQSVASFRAIYAADGVQELVSIVTPPEPDLDFMLLSGGRAAAADLYAADTALGSTVYTAGFAPESDQLSFWKGMVMSTQLGNIYLSDDGWSGGPVIDIQARVVGLINRGVGATIERPVALDADALHHFILKHGHPGLRA